MKSISSALTAMRRSPVQSLTATAIIAVTLFVGYSFSFLAMGAQEILSYFESRPQVIGFFELKTSNETIQEVSQQMSQKPYVEDVTAISQEEALVAYQDENREDPLLLELVTADILPASIEVSAGDVNSLVQVKQDLEGINAIEEVVFQQDVIDSLTNWTTSVRYIGLASIIVLSGTSFLIISALISMKVVNRKRAIQIMRFLGASGWFVKAPFFFEGAFYGLLGSIIGWATTYGLLLYLTPWLKDFLGAITLLPISPNILALQFGVGTVIAILLGGLAGVSAVQKIMK